MKELITTYFFASEDGGLLEVVEKRHYMAAKNQAAMHDAQLCSAIARNAKLQEALRAILKNKPGMVGREEAADMACEFWNIAHEALDANERPPRK